MTKKKAQSIDLEQINRHLASYIDDLLEKNKSLQAEIAILQSKFDELYFKYEALNGEYLDEND